MTNAAQWIEDHAFEMVRCKVCDPPALIHVTACGRRHLRAVQERATFIEADFDAVRDIMECADCKAGARRAKKIEGGQAFDFKVPNRAFRKQRPRTPNKLIECRGCGQTFRGKQGLAIHLKKCGR